MSEVPVRIRTPPSLGFWPKLELSSGRPMGSTLVHSRWGSSAPVAATRKSLRPGSSARSLPQNNLGCIPLQLMQAPAPLCAPRAPLGTPNRHPAPFPQMPILPWHHG